MFLLDRVFPVYCVNCHQKGAWLCQDCLAKTSLIRKQVCPYCHQPTVNGFTHQRCLSRYASERVFSLVPFRFPWRKAIHILKYRPYGLGLRAVIQELLTFWQAETQIAIPRDFVVVPIPLHWQKRFSRSYNQTEIIAELVARQYQLSLLPRALKRVKNTKTQASLPHNKRMANLKNAFAVRQKEFVCSRNILLVDDVITTGATMKEATKTLKKAGAGQVWCFTLARAG